MVDNGIGIMLWCGLALIVVKELGGWSDIRMVQRYAHLSSEHLIPYADSLSQLKIVGGTLLGTASAGYKKAANH